MSGRVLFVPFLMRRPDVTRIANLSYGDAGSAGPVVYAELPGAQHGFDRFDSIRFERVIDAVEDFAAWVRSREQLRPGKGKECQP
jgi:hypothetical protein